MGDRCLSTDRSRWSSYHRCESIVGSRAVVLVLMTRSPRSRPPDEPAWCVGDALVSDTPFQKRISAPGRRCHLRTHETVPTTSVSSRSISAASSATIRHTVVPPVFGGPHVMPSRLPCTNVSPRRRDGDPVVERIARLLYASRPARRWEVFSRWAGSSPSAGAVEHEQDVHPIAARPFIHFLLPSEASPAGFSWITPLALGPHAAREQYDQKPHSPPRVGGLYKLFASGSHSFGARRRVCGCALAARGKLLFGGPLRVSRLARTLGALRTFALPRFNERFGALLAPRSRGTEAHGPNQPSASSV